MSNCVHVIGHLGSDPVTRVTAKGTKITTFSVATNSREAGEDITIWWSITIWGDQFDYILPYLRKGSAVFITGKLKKPTTYDDKEGGKRISLPVTATSIDFLPSGKAQTEQGGMQQSYASAGVGTGAPGGGGGFQPRQQRSYGGISDPYGASSASPGHQQSHFNTINDPTDDDMPF